MHWKYTHTHTHIHTHTHTHIHTHTHKHTHTWVVSSRVYNVPPTTKGHLRMKGRHQKDKSVRGRPLNVIFKDDNFVLIWEPKCSLGVWFKHLSCIWVPKSTQNQTPKLHLGSQINPKLSSLNITLSGLPLTLLSFRCLLFILR